jgi:predicted Fe-Mo cluster-binding NifX family protein
MYRKKILRKAESMKRIAIPVFKSRISPVFDTSTKMLVIDCDEGKEIQRQEIFLGKLSLYERQRILESLDVNVFICGGITETFQKMIKTSDNQLITGRTGAVDEILAAYRCGKINTKKYQMPGCKPKK